MGGVYVFPHLVRDADGTLLSNPHDFYIESRLFVEFDVFGAAFETIDDLGYLSNEDIRPVLRADRNLGKILFGVGLASSPDR